MVTVLVLKVGQFAARTLRKGASRAGFRLLILFLHRVKPSAVASLALCRTGRETVFNRLLNFSELAGFGIVVGRPRRIAGYALVDVALSAREMDMLCLDVVSFFAVATFELFVSHPSSIFVKFFINFRRNQSSLPREIDIAYFSLATG
jgi:hypothetical protein